MKRQARLAAHLPWLLPCAALASLAILDRAVPVARDRPVGTLAAVALFVVAGVLAAALALRSGADPESRWSARVGIVLNVGLLSIVTAVAIGGVRSRGVAHERAAQLGRVAESSLSSYPGWYGVAAVGRTRLFAAEVSSASEFSRQVTRLFSSAFSLLVIGVDNRAGESDVVVDAGGVALLRADGTIERAVEPSVVSSAWRGDRETLEARRFSRTVRAGASISDLLVFLPPQTSLGDVSSLQLTVNGQPVILRGRTFSLDEKQAMRRAMRP